MECGWVKLHRKLLDSQVFANEGTLKVWLWCLLKANHGDRWVNVKTGRGETEVKVKSGQFVFGRKVAAKELNMKESTVWLRMRKLKKAQNIDIQPSSHFSIVSIINWDTYQQEPDTRVTGTVTGKQQPTSTNKNVKNVYSDKLQQFVSRFIEFIKTNNPKQMPKTKQLRENSLKEVDMLIRIDGFDLEYIRQVIGWAVQDDFWGNQVFSLAGLRRKSKNGLTKFQNISAAYDKNHKTEKIERVSVYQVAEEDL